jgi:undecaprenyl-diphosphatase
MQNIFSLWAESFDLPILDWIAAHLTCPFMDKIMPLITLLGDAGIFWIVLSLILMALRKHRKMGFSMAAALLIGLVVCNLCMKPLFARIRPYDYQLEHFGKQIHLLVEAQHDFSFPSGHTIASFEAAVAIFLRNKKWGIPALVLAVLISFSRLYLYVHYPSDVLCSVILGTMIAWIGCKLTDKAYTLKKN